MRAHSLVVENVALVSPPPNGEPDQLRQHQVQQLANLLRPCLGVSRARLVAHRLLERFGSLSEALAAPEGRLIEIAGVGHNTARHLVDIMQVAMTIAQTRIPLDRPLLSCWSELIAYCHVVMAFEPVEKFRILFLDVKNRLIADEVQQVGTVNHTSVYTREVIKRALELSASALILVHNHPAGDPAPSAADVRMTREIDAACKVLSLTLHDHIIIAKSGHASLRALKLI